MCFSIYYNEFGKEFFFPHVVRSLTVTVIHRLSQIFDLGFEAIILTVKGQIWEIHFLVGCIHPVWPQLQCCHQEAERRLVSYVFRDRDGMKQVDVRQNSLKKFLRRRLWVATRKHRTTWIRIRKAERMPEMTRGSLRRRHGHPLSHQSCGDQFPSAELQTGGVCSKEPVITNEALQLVSDASPTWIRVDSRLSAK